MLEPGLLPDAFLAIGVPRAVIIAGKTSFQRWILFVSSELDFGGQS
jgi:hypothetical protein